MLCCTLPGGVVAGVPGTVCGLLIPVSTARGWLAPAVGKAPEFHSCDGPWPFIPATVALVGGVGNVCALSRLGRPP
jgi:hypothetical protein